MAVLRTAHHGVNVSDIAGVADAFRVAGFTLATVGGIDEFRTDENNPRREVCLKGGPTYGEEFDTYVIEHQSSHQQLFLIEVKPAWRVDRPGRQPAQTDLTIVVPVEGDPADVYQEMRAGSPAISMTDPVTAPDREGIAVVIDGQNYVLTSGSTAFAVVHYSSEDFPSARAFYEETLGLPLEGVPGTEGRYRFAEMDAVLEVEVRDTTPALDPVTGKRYCGGSYFRMTNVSLSAVAALNLPAPEVLDVATGNAEWFFAPEGGAGYIYGPLGEMIELFDMGVDYLDSPPYCPEVQPV